MFQNGKIQTNLQYSIVWQDLKRGLWLIKREKLQGVWRFLQIQYKNWLKWLSSKNPGWSVFPETWKWICVHVCVCVYVRSCVWSSLFLASPCSAHIEVCHTSCPSSPYQTSGSQRGAEQQIVMSSGTFGFFLHFSATSACWNLLCLLCSALTAPVHESMYLWQGQMCFFNPHTQLHVFPCWRPGISTVSPSAFSCGIRHIWFRYSCQMCCVSLAACVIVRVSSFMCYMI